MATLHFVTGKGGVGKSFFSAGLAHQLSQKSQSPVLLIDILGHGAAAHYLGHTRVELEPRKCFDVKNLWVSRTEPHAAFKEYLSVLLSLGSSDNTFLEVTSRLRGSLTDLIAENKIVRAFIRACPGLEPIVMLGKVCWEARNGIAPEIEEPWSHIVVDSPASGHFVQLFQSTMALLQVFERGPITHQATRIVDIVRSPSQSHYYLVTLPEELPLREALDLNKKMLALELPEPQVVVNRYPFKEAIPDTIPDTIAPDWRRHFEVERERAKHQQKLLKAFSDSLARGYLKIEPVAGPEGKDKILALERNFKHMNQRDFA